MNRASRGSEKSSVSWLWRGLVANTPSSYRRAFCVLLTMLVTLFVLIVVHGPALQVLCGHDSMSFLSFAWKIRNGIYPNADYHIALGPLSSWIYAAGMWLLGPTASVLSFCNGLVGVATGLLAWTVAARRLPAALAGAFAFTQAIVAMSPHLMGSTWHMATYACFYNRQGMALVAVVMLTAFLPPLRHDHRRDEQRDAWTLGGVCGALLFLKITFGMAAIGLVILAAFTAKRLRRLLSWDLLGAFVVTVLLCLPMVRFDLFAMMRDLQMAAQVKAHNPNAAISIVNVTRWVAIGWVEIVCLGAAQVALRTPLVFRRQSDPTSTVTAPSWVEFAAVIGTNVFLLIVDSHFVDRSEMPLATSWLFVLAGYALRAQGAAREVTKPSPSVSRTLKLTCVCACCLWAYTFGAGLRCLCWSVWPWPTSWTQTALRESPVFDSESLATLRVCGDSSEVGLPSTYASKINDGLRLLRRLDGIHRVGTFDFNNPFPFALLWPPPRGDFWTWHYGITFGQFAHVAPEEAFGDADVLMIPKYPGEIHSFKPMGGLYGSYIKEHFVVATESDQWSLLRRRQSFGDGL